MFERFTDRARAVVMHAQEEARQLGHGYIGTEHLLLGLLADPQGLGARALAECGLDLERVRGAVESRVGRGAEAPRGHIAFTPRAKRVLELALRQALKLGNDYIGTEHVLLGVVAEGEGVAAQVLVAEVPEGLTAVRDATFAAMGRPPEALVGLEGRLVELARGVRARFGARTGEPDDEVRKRLEAIEARLSAIEGMLRQLLGREEAS